MSKIILTNEVSGLGSAGDVVEVKDGFARNYLLPRGFAVLWSKGGEKQVESIKAARQARALATVEDAHVLKAALEAKSVRLIVKAGQGGRLFGAVKTGDVVAAVSAAGLGELDKRKVAFVAPIKIAGEHLATVRLHGDVVATITLQVVGKK
jgi:large subunit ribosomal protein L9